MKKEIIQSRPNIFQIILICIQHPQFEGRLDIGHFELKILESELLDMRPLH